MKMDRSDFWAGLFVIGIIAGIIGIFVGVFYLILWLLCGTFSLFSDILEVGGVSTPIATTISLILVVIIALYCCCHSSRSN